MDKERIVRALKRGAYWLYLLAISVAGTWIFMALCLWAALEPPL